MPDIFNHPVGQRDPASLDYVAINGRGFTPVELQGVDIHAALFEVPRAEVNEILVPSLHPSMPSYAALTSYRVRDSTIGPFEFAVLGVACRNVIRPRMLTVSCFASTVAAAELLSQNWGFASCQADVRTRMRYDAARTEIRLGGRLVAEAITTAPETLLGTARAIRYPQAFNPVSIDGRNGLVQFDASYVFSDSYRGQVTLPVFDSHELSRGRLHPTDMIAGSYAKLESASLHPSRLLFDAKEVGLSMEINTALVA